MPSIPVVCHPKQYFSKLCGLGVFMDFSSNKYDQLLNPSAAPLSFLKVVRQEGGRHQKFLASHLGLIVLVTSFYPILKLSKSLPRVASLEQKTVLSLMKFQGIWELCARIQEWRPNIWFSLYHNITVSIKVSCYLSENGFILPLFIKYSFLCIQFLVEFFISSQVSQDISFPFLCWHHRC